MKNSFRFFSIVLVLLLASSIVLIGCMYTIAAENGDAKVYDMGSKISADSNIIVDDDTPTSQTELQKKFGAMYDISEDGKTITVISKEYLNNYWQSNYEKEVIHSLTTEEVYFIIQDSIRIYMEHDKVILAGFGSVSSNKQVSERFPFVEEREVRRPVTSRLDQDKIETDIHTIIMYRLMALSSPKAFFTGAEAICFVGGNPAAYNGPYPEAVYYIPGYSANTDRDYILSIMGDSTNLTDSEKFSDLFEISVEGGINIRFRSVANSSTTEVYPTEDMFKYAFGTLEDPNEGNDKNANAETPEIFKPYFILDIANKRFRFIMTLEVSSAISGSYVQMGDRLILYPYDGKAPEGYLYVFQYQEGVGYNYIKGESNPIPGHELEDETVFSLNDNLLKPTEK